MQEHDIQNAIRLHISQLHRSVIYRANVGSAWTGSNIERQPNGDVIIRGARPFHTGLPKGFPDLFGFTMVKITPDMAGKELPVFTAIEVKQPGKKPTQAQSHCLDFLREMHCLADVAHSTEEAEKIIGGNFND